MASVTVSRCGHAQAREGNEYHEKSPGSVVEEDGGGNDEHG